MLVVCPGLKLDWDKVDGLRDALGKNGVCSNYLAQHAEYTWECIKAFEGGTALFTQPAMPIKCAGAPQKIMYLAADHLRKRGLLAASELEFCLTGDVLFGVPAFVPPLQEAVDRYGIKLNYKHTLRAVDGPARKAVFSVAGSDGRLTEVVRDFEMMHVTPPQVAPDFVRESPLANAAGWVDVDPGTLRHARYGNVFGLGDAAGTTNAKTAACSSSSGARRGTQPAGCDRRQGACRPLRRLRLVPADDGLRQGRVGRVHLRRNSHPELSTRSPRAAHERLASQDALSPIHVLEHDA